MMCLTEIEFLFFQLAGWDAGWQFQIDATVRSYTFLTQAEKKNWDQVYARIKIAGG